MESRYKTRHSLTDYTAGVIAGDRIILSQAITLMESSLESDQVLAAQLMEAILPHAGHSIRVGITGVPGVGKSTFIESFGGYITRQGKKVAILTIDPSSPLTKGSILGDKTRMEDLAKNPMAFIRPSSSGTTLGGVALKTRESMLLCEAAGFEVVIIETVGVGQSEVAAKNMTDFFLLLMLAGAGDELQGIKKGIMEMADAIVITKADGDNVQHALNAQSEYQYALHLHASPASGWIPKVLTSSAVTNAGIEAVWKMITAFHQQAVSTGYFNFNRQQQNIEWMQEHVAQLLKNDFKKFIESADLHTLQETVANQKTSAQVAAGELLKAYHQSIRNSKS